MIDGWRLGRTDGGFGLEKFFGPSPVPVEINRGEFHEWHFFLPPGWREYNRASLEEVCAFQWISANRLALDAARDVPAEQWIQVRYEDIFERPVEMFRTVFARLGLPFDARMEAPLAGTLGASDQHRQGHAEEAEMERRSGHPEAIERILPAIAPLMCELGYALDD